MDSFLERQKGHRGWKLKHSEAKMYEGHSRRTKPLFFEYTENFSGNGKGGRGDRLVVYKVGNDQVEENNESSRCVEFLKTSIYVGCWDVIVPRTNERQKFLYFFV